MFGLGKKDDASAPSPTQSESIPTDDQDPDAVGIEYVEGQFLQPVLEPEPESQPEVDGGAGLGDVADVEVEIDLEGSEVSGAVLWTRPVESDATSVPDGPYRGRPQAGDATAVLRILPTVGSNLAGANVPDSIVDSGVVSPDISVGAVSVKGASHHFTHAPRQDAYAIGATESWVVIAIADGISEGKLSHLAASETVKIAVSETRRALTAVSVDEVDWHAVVESARSSVRELGRRRARLQVGPTGAEPEVSDLAIARLMGTTCDLIICPTRRVDGRMRVLRVRIAGDSSFYVLDPARGWGLVGSGKDTGTTFVDNSVGDPLPLGTGGPDITTWDLEPGQAVVLCTDGFGDAIGEGAKPVGRFLFDAWREPIDTTRLLQSASFMNSTADDDRTAAIIWATA